MPAAPARARHRADARRRCPHDRRHLRFRPRPESPRTGGPPAAGRCIWTLIKIICVLLPLLGAVAYLTLWERKFLGFIQVRHRPQPRRPVRPAAADRRRAQAADQGNHQPVGREPGPVPARPDHGHHAGAGRMGRDSLRPRGGAGQRQRRPAAHHGHHLDRGVRRDHRRLGLELEVRLPGRAARLGPDGELRNRDGLLPRRGASWSRAA